MNNTTKEQSGVKPSNSRKIDELSGDEINELSKMMEKKYQPALLGKKISISLHTTEAETEVVVLLASQDETFYYPIEARMDYQSQEMSAVEAQLFLIDYIDQYLEDYLLEDDSLMIPIDWTSYSYDAVDFQMKGQILNRKLEELASRLLEEHLN